MTSWVPRFDDWLNRRLEECAAVAGQDVDTYVAHAVAAQMVADQPDTDKLSLDQLLAHVSDAKAAAASALPPKVLAAISDPARLNAVYATGLLDSPPEEVYDRITRAAAAALDAPHASLTLIDAKRQFFKSSVGMKIRTLADSQTPLERSVCQYAVASGTPLVIDDARLEPMFKNNPAVLDGTLIAYVGIPLIGADGHAVGTLCVFDVKPRQWGTGHLQVLGDLAKIAAERIFAAGSRTAP